MRTGVQVCGVVVWFFKYTDIASLVLLFGFTQPILDRRRSVRWRTRALVVDDKANGRKSKRQWHMEHWRWQWHWHESRRQHCYSYVYIDVSQAYCCCALCICARATQMSIASASTSALTDDHTRMPWGIDKDKCNVPDVENAASAGFAIVKVPAHELPSHCHRVVEWADHIKPVFLEHRVDPPVPAVFQKTSKNTRRRLLPQKVHQLRHVPVSTAKHSDTLVSVFRV